MLKCFCRSVLSANLRLFSSLQAQEVCLDEICYRYVIASVLHASSGTRRCCHLNLNYIRSCVVAQNDDGKVDLTWQWDGESATFLILRNNFQIDETNQFKFSDSPIVAGSTNYTVIPVIDDQQLIAGSMTISDFEVDTTIDSVSGLSETGGLYLGVLFLVVSILITALGLLQRRD